MRVYLASTFIGMDKASRKEFISQGKPKYILETFFNGEKMCKEALSNTTRENFILDSGAFSYMSGAECTESFIEEYAERYIDFIKQNKITQYMEMDVDTIFGLPFVERIRKKMEQETGMQSIPVWHKSRGVDYWKRMCEEYKYIAVGGLVFHVKKKEYELIHKMVNYAFKKGVKVHGLGFTKTKELPRWAFYSVDSASWTKAAGRGQQRHRFNGRHIEAHRIDGKGKKIYLSKLIAANGIEWCKYQRYMEGQGYYKYE